MTRKAHKPYVHMRSCLECGGQCVGVFCDACVARTGKKCTSCTVNNAGATGMCEPCFFVWLRENNMHWFEAQRVAISDQTMRRNQRKMREGFLDAVADRRYAILGVDEASADVTTICTIKGPITLTVFFSNDPHDGEVQE